MRLEDDDDDDAVFEACMVVCMYRFAYGDIPIYSLTTLLRIYIHI
jgi:hypothetical protein